MGEAGAEPLPFFSAFVAYVLILHDAQTKVVDCRRTAANKVIGGGMGICVRDSHTLSPPKSFSSTFHHLVLCFPYKPQQRDPSVR